VDTVRIAVVSDIHGNLPALEAVVGDFARRGVDAVVNLGDSLSGPLLPRETAEYLMAQPWTQLAGNHERQILDTGMRHSVSDEYARSQLSQRELDWIAALGPCADYAEDVLLCHGTPHSDLVYLLETVEPGRVRVASAQEIDERLGATSAALIVCGHSHVPRSVRSTRGQLIVNPGSVGLPGYVARDPYPHVVENASPDARYAIVERNGGRWTSSLIAVPYDFRSMAELARRRGRAEWHRALLTGYVAQ
jgi:predicted phosphodiesterase